MNQFIPKEILNYIQPSEKKEEVAPEEKNEDELNNEDRMYLMNKKIDHQIISSIYQNLSDKKNLMYNEHQVDVNKYVYNDIELIEDYQSGDEHSLFTKLNYCQTQIGSLLLKQILVKPVYNQQILLKRQEYVQKIRKAKQQLLPLMEKIKNIENDVVWFWNDNSTKHVELMKDMIFFNWDFIPFFNVGEALNKNEKALLVTNIYKIIIAPLLTCLTPIISLLVPLIMMLYFNKKVGNVVSWKTVVSNYFKTIWNNDSMKLIIKNPTKANLASLATKGIYLFMYFQNVYYSVQSASNTNKIVNMIHEKLNRMTEYIQYSKQIGEICESCGLHELQSYLYYNQMQEDVDSYFTQYFCFPVFQKQPGLFTNKGKILQVYNEFTFHKDKLIQIFHYNGLIDVLLSIDHLLENSTKEHPYVMTTYLEKKKPQLNVKDIWHPYLNQEVTSQVVKNSVPIHQNLLITGPNAAGKSTFIKAIIINILLAQTIGINSCSVFEMVPFHLIETFLNIPDMKGTSSLFEAEMFRSKEYIEKIMNLDEDKYSFIVLDEIFSSTNYVEGFSGAYSILKKLSSFKNALFIVTTHYTDLEILEKDTKGAIKNYKFEVKYNEQKEIIFNYLMKEGISRQYIALDLLEKNGFSEDIIQDAKKICASIKNNKIQFKKNKKHKKEKNKTKEKKNIL